MSGSLTELERVMCPKCGGKDFHACAKEMRDTWLCYDCDQEWFKGEHPDTSKPINHGDGVIRLGPVYIWEEAVK